VPHRIRIWGLWRHKAGSDARAGSRTPHTDEVIHRYATNRLAVGSTGTVVSMADPLRSLAALGGVAHAAGLRDHGVTRRALDQALRAGTVERVRGGWYCPRGDSSDQVRALRVGGRLGCVSLLRMHRIWLMGHTRLHVAVSAPRSRLRTPANRGVALDSWPGAASVVTHWRAQLQNPHGPTDMLDDAAACVATCLPRAHAIVAFDSLLNSKLLTYERLRAALAGLPDSHEWMMDLVDAGCGSGLETLARLHLRRNHVRVRSQVHIPGIGWVDLLVGDRLVVELDSRSHHDDPAAYERDRARDLALVELGYIVVRVTYRRVMDDCSSVERALLAVIRRNEHRWQSSHRSAGIAVSLP
jgi:very-short-patch-repair endonuclease